MDKTDEEFYDLFVKIIYGKSLKQFLNKYDGRVIPDFFNAYLNMEFMIPRGGKDARYHDTTKFRFVGKNGDPGKIL